jgi:hypothetical protein
MANLELSFFPMRVRLRACKDGNYKLADGVLELRFVSGDREETR